MGELEVEGDEELNDDDEGVVEVGEIAVLKFCCIGATAVSIYGEVKPPAAGCC